MTQFTLSPTSLKYFKRFRDGLAGSEGKVRFEAFDSVEDSVEDSIEDSVEDQVDSVDTSEYASWFRDSTPYISAHRNKTFVVLLGGEALAHRNLTNIVHDLALLHVLGVQLVVIHGARPQIDTALPGSTFHGSRRVTDAIAMETILGIYGQLSARLEALFSTGLPTSPLHNTDIAVVSGNFVTARPIGVVDGVDHLIEIVEKDAQHRFELYLGKIRAKAGHRYPVEPASRQVEPPQFLYHGTSPDAAESILQSKILSMGKAYVHLASTIERATKVGLRKSKNPVILRIDAQAAHAAGLRFWESFPTPASSTSSGAPASSF
ncbi:MAG: RNA 2'-phosphotransferase [Proteobacteria bacterium]|nr:RNA 2'-phosphotransferase [Pseudomonadota bacterium]